MKQLSTATGRPLVEFERAAKDGRALGLPAYAKGALEGFAFPATYEVSPTSSPDELLAAMVTRFNRVAENSNLVDGARRVGRTPLEIMTIASIVQAESTNRRDMPKIARVIYNRLNHTPEMRLQVASPTMYAMNKFGIKASNEDLKSRSRYNTYARLGLPPGPICNPGADAIEAALKPAARVLAVLRDDRSGEGHHEVRRLRIRVHQAGRGTQERGTQEEPQDRVMERRAAVLDSPIGHTPSPRTSSGSRRRSVCAAAAASLASPTSFRRRGSVRRVAWGRRVLGAARGPE